MLKWVLNAPSLMELVENQPQDIDDINNVKVKIEKVLLSASDYEIYDGTTKTKLPFTFGRNAVGVVSVAGPDTLLQKMDRVAIEPFIPCSNCYECQDDKPQDCQNMLELGVNTEGLLSNFVNLPSTILHKLPDTLSNEKALFVSYVAMGLNIVDKLNPHKGQHVAVFTSTKVGVIVAQLIAYYQAVPILISDSPEVISAAQKCGIFYCIDSNQKDADKEVQMMTGGRMCKKVVMFANSNFALTKVIATMAFNGKLLIAGYGNKDSKLSLQQILQKHITVMGVYNGCGNFPAAINMLVTNTVNVDMMYDQTLQFSTLDKQLADLDKSTLLSHSKIINVDL